MKNQFDGSQDSFPTSTTSTSHSLQLGSSKEPLGTPRGVGTLSLLLLTPSLSTQFGKTAVKTPTFTYHTVQAPLLEFPPTASSVCVLRPAGKARDQVGLSPPDIPVPPLDCEFWIYHMELKFFVVGKSL